MKIINHVDCSLKFRRRRYFSSALLASALLLAAGVAINYRTVWCQIQAAAVIAITFVAMLFRERERKERTEHGVKQQHIVYCLNCRRTNQTALSFGSRVAVTRAESSIYEKLFVPIFSGSLMLGVWAGWIAYGALFHEGAHEAAVNEAIEVFFGFSDELPIFIHTMRAWLLFLFAVVSLFTHASFSLYHVVFLLLCSLLPPASATAQALSLDELTARTSLFCALFIVAETFEQNARYCAWLRTARGERNVVLVALHSALKGDRGTRPLVSTNHASIDVLSETEVGRAYSFFASASRIVSALRSSWILLVPLSGVPLGIVQVALMLALIARERSALASAVRSGKIDLIQFDTDALRTASKRNGAVRECQTSDSFVAEATMTTTASMTKPISSVRVAPLRPSSPIGPRRDLMAVATSTAAPATAPATTPAATQKRPPTPVDDSPQPPPPPLRTSGNLDHSRVMAIASRYRKPMLP